MATSSVLLPFLRPSPAPGLRFVRDVFKRMQSNSSAKSISTEDPNLIASRSASRSYPPPSLKSQPRPKESRASHRTSQPTKVKDYPDKRPRTALRVSSEKLAESECAPNLPYYVTRTASNELPVYQFSKGGGNKELTRIRKIDGNPLALRDAIRGQLGLNKEDCAVNALTRQVIVKGHVKQQIEAFLTARNF